MSHAPGRAGPLAAAALFGALAVAWVVGTDFLAERLVSEDALPTVQTIKGVVFVTAVAVAAYVALRARQWRLDVVQSDLLHASRRAELLALLLQHADAAVIGTDMDGEIIVWNRGAERIFGWTEEEAVGMQVGEATVPHEEMGPASEIMDVMRRTGRWAGEFRVRRKDGSAFSAWVSNRVVRGPGGRPVGIVGVSVDVTPYKEQFEAVRLVERRLVEILDALPVPHLTVDTRLEVRFANTAAREAFSLDAAAEGLDLVAGPVGGELRRITSAALSGEDVDGTMLSVEEPDGRSLFLVSAAVQDSMARPGERFVLLALVDVTQPIEMRARLEDNQRALAEHAEALRRSNRGLQQFAHAASHELVEPLRTIGLATERLRRRVGTLSQSEIVEGLETIAGRSRRSKEMIDALLEFSTVSPVAPTEPVDARAVVSEVVTDRDALVERTGAEVTWQVDEAELWVDRNVLAILVGNLVSNAIKFVPDGVTPVVRVRGRVEGDRWVLTVADNGVGIASGEREEVFGLLTRSGDLDRDGVGMGLALVRRIVEGIGGTVSLGDAPAGGTIATLEVPVRQP